MIIFDLKKSAIECFLSQELNIWGVTGTRGNDGPFSLKEQIKYRQFLKQKNTEKYFQFFY